MKKNLYRVLGVRKTATAEEVKAAYRKLAMKNHPDRNPGDEKAAKKYLEVTEAYEVLSDEARRRHYDETGEVGRPVNNRAARLVPVIASVLMTAIQEICQAGGSVKKMNVVEVTRKEVKERLKGLKESRKVLEDTVERFTNHNGEDNLLQSLVRQQLEGNAAEIKVYEEVLDFLKTYGYTVDQSAWDMNFPSMTINYWK